MVTKRQGYDSRLDESLGTRNGAERTFHQTIKSRRDESKGMEKREKKRPYSGDHEMDVDDKKRLRHHMLSAHHKFMAQHHRRKMNKK